MRRGFTIPKRLKIVLTLLGSACLVALAVPSASSAPPNQRETKVRNDKQKMEADDFWIYNDLDRGLSVAKREKKPLLVVFRCIP